MERSLLVGRTHLMTVASPVLSPNAYKLFVAVTRQGCSRRLLRLAKGPVQQLVSDGSLLAVIVVGYSVLLLVAVEILGDQLVWRQHSLQGHLLVVPQVVLLLEPNGRGLYHLDALLLVFLLQLLVDIV